MVFTDDWDAYATVFAKGQHQVEGKQQTTLIERFNNTLRWDAGRQRCARLVRKALPFSKTWENHYLAIKYFLVCYNLERLAKKPSLRRVHYQQDSLALVRVRCIVQYENTNGRFYLEEAVEDYITLSREVRKPL
ncbi:IS1 family transposase [Tunicatimonas pelagia]|nr:IS1 family transposase [Tunicatimonas pelagia]WKN45426.1 IS1 family transposase [Tunicatimonas pelagia]